MQNWSRGRRLALADPQVHEPLTAILTVGQSRSFDVTAHARIKLLRY
jgi:hypothetical protein